MKTKTLSDRVKINAKFCRSVNIAQDSDDLDILRSFICPDSFRLALRVITDNISATNQAAFTWTGPYGAGKSSLALLLSALLSKKLKLRNEAKRVVGNAIATAFYNKIPVSKGWAFLPIVGDVKNAEELIKDELKKQKLITRQKKDIFATLQAIADENDGLLIIIDEMGKCLEAVAKGTDGGDIFFYQKLAEFASRSNGKIIVIGILHQSFVDYARNLPHVIRDEWNKVQGRFVDTPINTAGEEQFELISKAIDANTDASDIALIKPAAEKIAEIIGQNKHVISTKSLAQTLCKCWPIHPIVVSLLSQISRKKFGQNQRSIFSFLSSGEPYAFRDFVTNTTTDSNALYMPANLFDYIKTNLESSITASSESKIWHIAIDAIQKVYAKGLSDDHIAILKTIALIDLFGNSSGLSATKDLLCATYPQISKKIPNVLEDLRKASVILFKNYKNSYSVFEGSDFDIDSALQEAYRHSAVLDTSKLIDIANFKPIIAKRYYHMWGAMRWFDVLLTNTYDYENTIENARKNSNSVGFFCIILPTSDITDQNKAKQIAKQKSKFDFPVINTVANNTRLISEYLRDLLALEWVQTSSLQGFVGDSVANKMVEDRCLNIISYLETELDKILQQSDWFYNGKLYKDLRISQLSALASSICEEEYSKAPKVKSELINKTKPSGSANTALNKLLHAMVLNSGEPDLKMVGFSTEAGLFKILLKDTGIYKQYSDEEWKYALPSDADLLNLWEDTDHFLEQSSSKTVEDIFEKWQRKPYGIKKGLCPILMLSYILTKPREIAAYKDGMYQPTIDDFFVDVFTKESKNISLKLVKTNERSRQIMASVIEAVNNVLDADQSLPIDASVLEIGQKLAHIIDHLHPWVLKTRSLSNTTTRFREIVKSASDPNKLIFEDIVKLFPKDNLCKNLTDALNELLDKYPSMLKEFALLMTAELDVPLVTPETLKELRIRASNIQGVSGNFLVNAFISRISTFDSTAENIAGIIGLSNNKSQNDWIDLDIDNAKKEIVNLCTEFKKAELYAKVKGRKANRQAIAFIAGIGDTTEIVSGDFDILKGKKTEVNKIKKQISDILSSESDKNLILTALSELSIELLKTKDKK